MTSRENRWLNSIGRREFSLEFINFPYSKKRMSRNVSIVKSLQIGSAFISLNYAFADQTFKARLLGKWRKWFKRPIYNVDQKTDQGVHVTVVLFSGALIRTPRRPRSEGLLNWEFRSKMQRYIKKITVGLPKNR